MNNENLTDAQERLLRKLQEEYEMNNGTLTEEQKQGLQAMQALNLDEVVNETIHVKVIRFKDELLFDDDGQPFCDEHGNQYKGRTFAGTRTAKIKNIVPVDVYNEAIGMSGSLEGGMPTKQDLEKMTELVLRIWKISEPFMTMEMLTAGVEGEYILALFSRFFNRENRPNPTKA